MSGARAVPWGVVGFLIGAGLGLAWGQRAKTKVGESVTTSFESGVLSIRVDTVQAARAGLPAVLDHYIGGR